MVARSQPVPAAASEGGGTVSVSRVITKEELCLMERVPSPCAVVIFGASGDLTQRKLLPALFALQREGLLPASFFVLGLARSALTDETFRGRVREALAGQGTAPERESFSARCYYLSGGYEDDATYASLGARLAELERAHRTGGCRLLYLSTPPALYEPIARRLGEAGLAASEGASSEERWTRVVVEKPFGADRASAARLNRALHRAFRESQVYRIDHYLGKETVQNVLMFRFANAIFEPVWNHHYIDHVQITAAETAGVGHRAGYFERSGTLRDMFQNHLFQLMSLVAMEPPSSFSAEAVRDEKVKVMAALCASPCQPHPERAVRGQDARGRLDGREVPGYREEPGVDPASTTETFAALRVDIDTWRWHGVPFFLRSGKRLGRRDTGIAVQFKRVPTSIFKPLMAEQLAPNVLQFRIQPEEGIALGFEAKHPGPKLCLSTVTMEFNYQQAFGVQPPEAYARLFLDVMLGDPTLFARPDWLDHAWSFLDPIVARWAEQGDKGLHPYPAGSGGPIEADALIEKEGRQWLAS